MRPAGAGRAAPPRPPRGAFGDRARHAPGDKMGLPPTPAAPWVEPGTAQHIALCETMRACANSAACLRSGGLFEGTFSAGPCQPR